MVAAKSRHRKNDDVCIGGGRQEQVVLRRQTRRSCDDPARGWKSFKRFKIDVASFDGTND
jgi:hypothetical protein